MQRYTLTSYNEACPTVREMYNEFLQCNRLTDVPIWVQSLGHSPTLLKAYWERAKGSLACGALPLMLKEMVIFVVSVENGSRYCSASHAHAILSLDSTLKFEDLNELLNPAESRLPLPSAFRAALIFAQQVAQSPNAVTDRMYLTLRRENFTAAEISELLSVLDLAMMFNSYTSTLRLPLDPQYRPFLEQESTTQ
jgi:alkylhydroperoxidase family enzyme